MTRPFHLNKARVLIAGLLIAPAAQCFAANPGSTGTEAARESLKRFSVADALEVTLFGSEPMVRKSHRLSVMPARMQQLMTTQELVDLVDYLLSLRVAASQ